MLFGAASRPRPRGASIRREDEKRRLKTTDVASVRSPEIPPVREYVPRRSVDGRGSCVFLCGESPPPPGGSDPSKEREDPAALSRVIAKFDHFCLQLAFKIRLWQASQPAGFRPGRKQAGQRRLGRRDWAGRLDPSQPGKIAGRRPPAICRRGTVLYRQAAPGGLRTHDQLVTRLVPASGEVSAAVGSAHDS